ncbi:28S ribosomal protein S6, mitochondrial [Galendromus occidentalis]|uniref:Small ribosomal subunit protein bS6m n=1 Tax=Galendromus occidentalis TaxID=34638 RepID=A0AAJ7L6K4_9ACAR|nr:28S ribosomal protein S6, mitochondrial [Galendromus occidentalis]
MPLYELTVVMRNMQRPELVACMKRTGELILSSGSVLRAIENLGLQREIAYKMRAHGKGHTVGSFILYRLDCRTNTSTYILDELDRDTDVVKTHMVGMLPQKNIECTLEDELQIPMLRPSVQKLMRTGKKPEKVNPILEKIKGPF